MPWLMRFVLYSLMFMGTVWLVRRLRGHMTSSFNGAYSRTLMTTMTPMRRAAPSRWTPGGFSIWNPAPQRM